jgi:hypothetical protein
MAIKLSTVARNAAANAVVDLADDGYIRIYDGTQAANPQTAIGSQVLLAELRFGTPAFGAAATGTATAEAITADVSANNTGTATWFRVLQSDGTTVLWDGTVSTSGADLNLASGTSITSGDNIAIDSMTYTQPES